LIYDENIEEYVEQIEAEQYPCDECDYDAKQFEKTLSFSARMW
jgi:hypothetical protein